MASHSAIIIAHHLDNDSGAFHSFYFFFFVFCKQEHISKWILKKQINKYVKSLTSTRYKANSQYINEVQTLPYRFCRVKLDLKPTFNMVSDSSLSLSPISGYRM